MIELSFTVPDEYNGTIVKVFLRRYCSISARLLVKLKHVPMGITCNGVHIRVIDTIKTGDKIKIQLPEDKYPAIANKIDMPPIIFEDEHILIVNKPYNLPVHPSPGHYDDSLANAVAAYWENNGEGGRAFRPVYRLDRDTTGLQLIAKHAHAAKMLAGNIDKEYIAIVSGNVSPKCGTIDLPIRRCEGYGIKREVGDGGERAVTHYKVILCSDNISILSIHLETGRTHQIRTHFSYLGHPLLGDFMYGRINTQNDDLTSDCNIIGKNLISRQALHCANIKFYHPISGYEMNFSAELPDDMQKIVDNISHI